MHQTILCQRSYSFQRFTAFSKAFDKSIHRPSKVCGRQSEKFWSGMVCFTNDTTLNFLKVVFHKFYLVPSWILSLIPDRILENIELNRSICTIWVNIAINISEAVVKLFCKIDVLKKFHKFHKKTPVLKYLFNKVAVSCEIFKSSFFDRTPLEAASDIWNKSR